MCAEEMARYFKRAPWRGHKVEAAEQREKDRLVEQILDRQREIRR